MAIDAAQTLWAVCALCFGQVRLQSPTPDTQQEIDDVRHVGRVGLVPWPFLHLTIQWLLAASCGRHNLCVDHVAHTYIRLRHILGLLSPTSVFGFAIKKKKQGLCGGSIDAIANAAISFVHGADVAPWMQVSKHACTAWKPKIVARFLENCDGTGPETTRHHPNATSSNTTTSYLFTSNRWARFCAHTSPHS